MKIIFAQGNPGSQYEKTRHNVGWILLDIFTRSLGVSFMAKPKFNAAIAEFVYNGAKVLIVKPTTFYNETGISARALADFYKVKSQDILVLHDDLMIDFGKIRIREQGSDAGNNGIKSLNAHLGKNYPRLRIGIYTKLRDRISDADFVLKNFSKDELETIESRIYDATTKQIYRFLDGKLAPTSIDINKDSQ